MSAHDIAEWIRTRLTPKQIADVAAQRVLVGDLLELPDWWEEEEVIEAVELLSAQPPRFKVVPTPDHGTRLVPVDHTPKTEEEWLAAACEHDITYGQNPTPPGSHTPGPWDVSRHATPESHPQFGVYFSGRCASPRSHDLAIVRGDNAEADARLISAAPELLEALENLLAHEGEIEVSSIGVELDSEALVAARRKAKAAIAKATGH